MTHPEPRGIGFAVGRRRKEGQVRPHPFSPSQTTPGYTAH